MIGQFQYFLTRLGLVYIYSTGLDFIPWGQNPQNLHGEKLIAENRNKIQVT